MCGGSGSGGIVPPHAGLLPAEPSRTMRTCTPEVMKGVNMSGGRPCFFLRISGLRHPSSPFRDRAECVSFDAAWASKGPDENAVELPNVTSWSIELLEKRNQRGVRAELLFMMVHRVLYDAHVQVFARNAIGIADRLSLLTGTKKWTPKPCAISLGTRALYRNASPVVNLHSARLP